jgi:DNA-binding CsgD family transcriptional regulator
MKSLTKRERELLLLILEGSNNAELADKVGIAKATAKIHRQHIYKKMNVDSLMALMKLFDVGPHPSLIDKLAVITPKSTQRVQFTT